MTVAAPQRRSPEVGDNPRATGSVLPLVRRMHFYAGVLVAPLLVVLCLTGLAFAATPQLDKLVYRHEFSVGHTHSATTAPLDAQVRAARAAYPQGQVVAVEPPADPDRTTGIDLLVPGLPDGAVRTVYVDPYTATVRGALTTTNGRPPLQQWLWTMHGELHLGTVGRWYSEIAASWLPILLIGGLALWFGRRRRDGALLPRLRVRPGRARTRNIHVAVGLVLTLGLAGLTVTGLTWSHYAGTRFETVLDALHGHTPALTATRVPQPPSGPGLSVDQIQQIARQQGLQPTTITLPKSPGASFFVSENRDHWPIKRSSLAIDAHTGAVTGRLDFGDYPILAKLSTIGIRLHEGLLFGLANQIALAALAIGTLVLLGAGYRMWWQRRPPSGRRFAPPPPRGAWRHAPTPALLIGIPVVVVLGWLMPLFGVTLAGFLVLDATLGYRRRHPCHGREQRRSATVCGPLPAGDDGLHRADVTTTPQGIAGQSTDSVKPSRCDTPQSQGTRKDR